MASAELSKPADVSPGRTDKGSAGYQGSSILAGFNRLNMLRQAGLLIALSASIALGFGVVLWSQKADYQPLYPSMQGFEMAEVVEVLEVGGVNYRIDPSSGVLLVPSDQVSAIRLQVASAGVTRDNGYGYELLDQDQSLGTSQFMETNRYRRSLEGELQRTIMNFRSVQSARVHLATPERSVFVRNSRKPTASVFLSLVSGRQLTDVQVKAIANLVASSVPELAPDDVTVVDQHGNLLSRREADNEFGFAAEQFEYVRRYEETLVSRVNRILHPLLGAGRFTAEVAADIDFTRVEQAAETFNPDVAAVRSEQSLDEQRVGSETIAGIPGALTNQPPPAGVAPEQLAGDAVDAPVVPQSSRNQATRNYELDRTLSYTQHDPVQLRRLSVAVVIDEPEEAGVAGWTAEDLDRITALVRDAVGYSAARGDSVTVINRRFAQPPLAFDDSTPLWSQPWFAGAVKQVAAAALVLLLVFGILMPTLKRLATPAAGGRNMLPAPGAASAEAPFAEAKPAEGQLRDENVTLSGGDDILLAGPTDSYERQLQAVKGLVAQDPGRVAQVVKNWISNDS